MIQRITGKGPASPSPTNGRFENLSFDQRQPIAGAANRQEALLSLVSSESPTGRIERNQDTVAQSSRDSPLAALTATIRVGSDNLPRLAATHDDDSEAYQLARAEHRCMIVVARRGGVGPGDRTAT